MRLAQAVDGGVERPAKKNGRPLILAADTRQMTQETLRPQVQRRGLQHQNPAGRKKNPVPFTLLFPYDEADYAWS